MVALQYRHAGIIGAVLPAALAVSIARYGGVQAPNSAESSAATTPRRDAPQHNSTAAEATPPPPRPPQHFIITPSDAVIRRMMLSLARAPPLSSTTPADSAVAGTHSDASRTTDGAADVSGPPLHRIIRFEDLCGDDLSTMLQMAAAMTNRSDSYTFHSTPHASRYCGGYPYPYTFPPSTASTNTGEASSLPPHPSSSLPTSLPHPHPSSTFAPLPGGGATNSAVLHIVRRTKGDLPINNFIYAALSAQCSVVPMAVERLAENEASSEAETKAEAEEKGGGVGLEERYRILAGAATYDCPQPNTLLASDTPEGDRRRAIVAEELGTDGGGEGLGLLWRRVNGNVGEEEEGVADGTTTAGSARVDAGHEKKKDTANDNDDESILLARRLHFSLFLSSLQSDVRTGDADLTYLQTNISPTLRGRNGLSEEEANAVNLAPSSPTRPPAPLERPFYFWPYKCDYRSAVAYETTHFVVLVNLKPVTQGHLMVVPRRIMPTIHTLSPAEISEWGFVVRHAALALRRAHPDGQGVSVAIQQGAPAGQTVPHLHTHVIVFREDGELSGEPEPEEVEQERRRPRTLPEMQAEADALRALFIATEAEVGGEAVCGSPLRKVL